VHAICSSYLHGTVAVFGVITEHDDGDDPVALGQAGGSPDLLVVEFDQDIPPQTHVFGHENHVEDADGDIQEIERLFSRPMPDRKWGGGKDNQGAWRVADEICHGVAKSRVGMRCRVQNCGDTTRIPDEQKPPDLRVVCSGSLAAGLGHPSEGLVIGRRWPWVRGGSGATQEFQDG